MDFNVDEIEEYTNEELQNELDDIIDEWDRSNTVFKANGSVYHFADIYRMEEPKSQYPAFDPARYTRNGTPEARKNAIESMAKGIKKCIPSKTGKPEKILELMRLRFSQIK
jgi:hypothetical protein